MIVIQLRDAPPGLGGWLSRWLMEIGPGVFVGKVNAKVREELWKEVCTEIHTGAAVMAWPSGGDPDVDVAFAGPQARRRVSLEGFIGVHLDFKHSAATPNV